jgi:hypothetical protein
MLWRHSKRAKVWRFQASLLLFDSVLQVSILSDIVLTFAFLEFEKSNGTENKKLKVVDMDVDGPKKAKSAKNEVETAKKAKEMLKRGEIKPMLSKEELDNAVPLAGSDDSDADLVDTDEAEDGKYKNDILNIQILNFRWIW